MAQRRWNGAFTLSLLCALIAPSMTRAQEKFSIVILPDTQGYTDASPIAKYGDIYAQQTSWIARQKAAGMNVRFVVSVGDMTDDNAPDQWQIVRGAHATLDSLSIPYNVASGNHDTVVDGLPFRGIYRRTSLLDESLLPYYDGAYDGDYQNNYRLFQTGDNRKFMVLSLEYAPRKDVIDWANRIIQQHRDRLVILMTHSHLDPRVRGEMAYTDSEAIDHHLEGRDGEEVWQEIGSRHNNIIAILSGHIPGTRSNIRQGATGNSVLEVASNFQSERVMGTGVQLGNGWLRVLTFDQGKVEISTVNIFAERGNTQLFPGAGGRPQLFLTGIYDPMLVPLDFALPPVEFAYWYDDAIRPSFRDRLAHKTLTGDHLHPKLATNASGDFVAVWQDDADGNGSGQIHARAFTPDGVARTEEITVNTTAAGKQEMPDVAMADNGNFVVVWQDDKGGTWDIMARGFKADGTQLFAQTPVNSPLTGKQLNPAVAADPQGNFVVAWEDDKTSNNYWQIHGRAFTASGSPRGSSFVVNQVTTNDQTNPAIGMDDSGNFVIAWEDSRRARFHPNIFYRRFDGSGLVKYSEAEAHMSDTNGYRWNPSIAVHGGGDFVIAWEDDRDGDRAGEVHATIFNNAGTAVLKDMTVSGSPDRHKGSPSVAMDPFANFFVAWEEHCLADADGCTEASDIKGSGFAIDGTQLKAAFTVSYDDNADQRKPAVALDNNGRAFFAWQDDMDGDSALPRIDRACGYNVLVKGVPDIFVEAETP